MIGPNFNPVNFILIGAYILLLIYGGRILDIIERVVTKDRPPLAGAQARRHVLRRYLASPEFWIGGLLIGALFFVAGLAVQCGWFGR